MATLPDGSSVEVQGSGTNRYVLERKKEVYSCTCPAWKKQTVPIERRSCKHLVAYLGSDAEAARVGNRAMPRGAVPRPPPVNESADARAAREEILAQAVARFPAVRDKMMTVYGLRLPKHLAYAAGFFLALRPEEHDEAWSHFGCGLAGVGEWFEDDALERQVRDGLDERLEMRYRRDPPEMVTIFSGNSDGGHWGLWYDDAKALPTLVVQNYARDSAETCSCEPTLLATLYKDDKERRENGEDDGDYPHRAVIFNWLKAVLPRELAAHREENIARPPARTNWLVGSLDPCIPGWTLPADLAGFDAQEKRLAAYRAGTAEVGQWIAQARAELLSGQPGRALFLGNELHWFDGDAWRDECTELLVDAYTALDRKALADIVRVHHRHRDLQSVDVYKSRAEVPLVYAVCDRNVALVKQLLASGVSARDRAEALLRADQIDLIELLLAEGADGLDAALEARLQLTANPLLDEPLRAQTRELAKYLLGRAGIYAAAFTNVLRAGDAQLVDHAITHADLTARDAKGLQVLHLAVQLGLPTVVQQLLDRGASATAKDTAKQTPYDHARVLWQNNPREAGRIFTILTAAGGGPPSPPVAPGQWAPGVAAVHPKFGRGIVEKVTGRFANTMLHVRFGSEVRVLPASFFKKESTSG